MERQTKGILSKNKVWWDACNSPQICMANTDIQYISFLCTFFMPKSFIGLWYIQLLVVYTLLIDNDPLTTSISFLNLYNSFRNSSVKRGVTCLLRTNTCYIRQTRSTRLCNYTVTYNESWSAVHIHRGRRQNKKYLSYFGIPFPLESTLRESTPAASNCQIYNTNNDNEWVKLLVICIFDSFGDERWPII